MKDIGTGLLIVAFTAGLWVMAAVGGLAAAESTDRLEVILWALGAVIVGAFAALMTAGICLFVGESFNEPPR